MKALHEMTRMEKGRLLGELFPAQIPKVINYIKERLKYLKADEQLIRRDWRNNKITHIEWFALAWEVDEVVKKFLNPEMVSAQVFGDQLFYDLKCLFTVECLEWYAANRSNYPRFQKMVSVLFE